MSDSSATVIIIFVIFLMLAGGGTAAWYFLYYKPRQGPAPAPVYYSPPVVYTTTPPASTTTPPSADEDDGEDDGEDDYDPIELGEVVSPAGSPSAKFSLALWRAKMKKKFGKNRAVLQKRLKVLEAARDADKEQSGTVPSEHFDDAIKYLKDLIKALPKASAPAPVPTKVAPKFNFESWKIQTKKDIKMILEIKKPESVVKGIRSSIDRLKDAQTKKLASKDGVPRAKYNEAIAWLRVLEKESSKKSKKFNLAAWKKETQKKLKNKTKQEIQRVITRFENSTAAVHDGVPKASKAQAIAFLKGLKAKK